MFYDCVFAILGQVTASERGGPWRLHHFRHAALTHLSDTGASTPLLMAKSWHGELEFIQTFLDPSAAGMLTPAAIDPVSLRVASQPMRFETSLGLRRTSSQTTPTIPHSSERSRARCSDVDRLARHRGAWDRSEESVLSRL